MTATTDSETDVIEMSHREIDEALGDIGYGTLSLVSEGNPYGIPVSFGYDGDRIFGYFFRFGDDGKKMDFGEQTPTACLTAFQANSSFDWRSVIVTGTLRDVAEAETEYVDDVMAENAWFPSVFPQTTQLTGVRRVELRIQDASGRKGKAYW